MSLAWGLRTAMVTAAAVVAYLLVQTEVIFDPSVRMVLGAIAVGLAAISPQNIADKITG